MVFIETTQMDEKRKVDLAMLKPATNFFCFSSIVIMLRGLLFIFQMNIVWKFHPNK